uniref:Uncharacterized protein n=1 Tax=Avena sativa TaxID=4498 RepID=A0ACD5UQX8_AVESA
MYQMGLYLLPEGTHADFAKELSRFFWAARDNRQKYHIVKWVQRCVPKILGGIGILDSHRFNLDLMLKWVGVSLRDDGGLWVQFIKTKYLWGRPLLPCERREGSQFWRAIQEIKECIRQESAFNIGGGGGVSMDRLVVVGFTSLRGVPCPVCH